MGNVSKYEGGSKTKSFRLPAKFFDQATKEVEAVLSKYEKKPLAVGVRLSGKEYYDLAIATEPFDKVRGLFLEATPSSDLLWRVLSQEEHDKLREEALPYVNAIMEERYTVDPDYMDKVLKSINITRPTIGMIERWDPISDEDLMKEKEIIEFGGIVTDSRPEERIPGTLKKKLQELDPNIIIPGDKK